MAHEPARGAALVAGAQLRVASFDQLRQAAVGQPSVLAALARALRMLVVHVREEGRDEHVAVLEHHLDLVHEVARTHEGITGQDVERLTRITYDRRDPGEHARG